MDGPSSADLLVIERLVYARWGGRPPTSPVVPTGPDVEGVLARVARRHGWTLSPVPGLGGCASYVAHEWRDRYGNMIGWTLLTLNIAAVSERLPEFGLPPEFHLISHGPLFDALSADGTLVLPDAEWLLESLAPEERAAIRESDSGNGWEANNLKYWKPQTRAETLFNHWD